MISFPQDAIREQRQRPLLLVRALAMIGESHQTRISTAHRHVPVRQPLQDDQRLRSFAIQLEFRDGTTAADLAQFWHMLQPQQRYSFRLNTEVVGNFLIGQPKIGQSGDRRCRIRAQSRARFSRAGRVASFRFASTHHCDFRRYDIARISGRPRRSHTTRAAGCPHLRNDAAALR